MVCVLTQQLTKAMLCSWVIGSLLGSPSGSLLGAVGKNIAWTVELKSW